MKKPTWMKRFSRKCRLRRMLAARKVLKFKAAETSEFGIAEFSVKVDLGRGGVG